MTLMSEFKLTDEIVEALNDYFTAEELCDFLEIETRELVTRFEDEVVNRIEDLLEELRWYDIEEEDVVYSEGDYDD